MPELYEDVVKTAPEPVTTQEQEIIRKLLEYCDEKHNPNQEAFKKIVAQCYAFKELDQWSGEEKSLLQSLDVPPIAIDRINRSLEIIDGIKAQSNIDVTVSKGEKGDELIALMFDRIKEYVKQKTDYSQASDEAFDNCVDVGVGLRIFGWDSNLARGEGMFWFETINPEDCGWSYTRKKNFSDIRWFWYKTIMDWQDAIRLNPNKAAQLNAMKATLQLTWENLHEKSVSYPQDQDYGADTYEGKNEYPDQVEIWNIWVKRTIPYKRIQYQAPSQFGVDAMGNIVEGVLPQIRMEAIDYTPAEGEIEAGNGVIEKWYQHIVATGQNKKSGVLLTPPQGLEWKYEWPPLVPTIAEFKKNGMPRGFIEKAIPHQKRINVAWALSIAYNSHAIKSPLVIQTQDGTFDVANAEKQSQFGGIFVLKHGETPIAMNVVPNVNLHAIEEGREAKGDMDFAVSASEPVLRGQSDATSSGIKVATLQSAAVGPLNKWLQAFRVSEIEITRRLLPMILDHFTIERIQRIVGDDLFMRVMTATPPQHNVADYDVVATDQSISDLNKQQSFNAASALHQMGFIMDAKYMIMNAPIKNPDEALASHERAEADVVRMLLAENEMLKAQVGEMKKMIPRGGGGQAANAQRGKNQPQAGKRSMIGGTSPLTQVST